MTLTIKKLCINHNDDYQNDTRHNDTQRNSHNYNTQHNVMLSVTFFVMLRAVLMSVAFFHVRPTVILQSVGMPNVMARNALQLQQVKNYKTFFENHKMIA
jgi:hypothetical protein